ncbi:MAG: hypothetical protein V4671_28880 [Armatimonadota bacterium]
MQKIRDTFHHPLSLSGFVVGSGVILFLMGVCQAQVAATPSDIDAARLNLIRAGWVLTLGWVLKRIENRQWPFPVGLVGRGAPVKTTCARLLVVGTVILSAFIWRFYGPEKEDYVPAPAAVKPSSLVLPGAALPRSTQILPISGAPLSLMAAPRNQSMMLSGSSLSVLRGRPVQLGIPRNTPHSSAQTFDSAYQEPQRSSSQRTVNP